jgi:hypothetical protein
MPILARSRSSSATFDEPASDLLGKCCDQIGLLPYNWHVLTEEDKQWISERLEKVETTLLTESSERLGKVETTLLAEFSERLEKVETTLLAEFSERLEKVETTLLTEFHKWASPVELRQRSHAAALRALDTEVESLSDRLKNLEGR